MKKIVFIASLVLCFLKIDAQDMHFTQFYASAQYLNPAFVGTNVCSRVSATYRTQWMGVSNAYRSYLVSFDHYLPSYKLGVGLLFGNDVAGSGELKTTIINPQIAYETSLNRKISLRVGAQPGIGIRSINFNKLVFGDQIARGGNVSTIETPTQSRTYFDASAGILVYSQSFWIGSSFFHLNRPNESLFDLKEARLPVKYSIHGGYKYVINNDKKEPTNQTSVSFVFNYRGQEQFDQVDIGTYYTRYIFNLGLWYRGIPALKAYKPGYSNNDAIAIIVGVQADKYHIGYSYDMTISKLTYATKGAHELTISYQFCEVKKKRRKRLLVPCPKF